MNAARDRVLTVVRAARRIADASDPLGRSARERLVASTGLSAHGVDLALTRCLETNPSDAELELLCAAAPVARRAHVILSANVFTAAHRAVALALASSEQVFVRPSRREPHFVELLAEAAPGSFSIVSNLAAEPGDHVFAYGRDETLAALRTRLSSGVVLHAHGSGFGIAVIDLEARASSSLPFRALARDVAAFDQRGCLSPRLVFVRGSLAEVDRAASAITTALELVEREVPRGTLWPDELAEIARYRDAAAYAGQIRRAGSGFVSSELDANGPIPLPPVGRNLHVVAAHDLARRLAPLSAHAAAVGFAGGAELESELEILLPRARRSALGEMQSPKFDGPVDLRVDPRGQTL